MAKNCPKCRLINPPTAKRCDCGYDFHTDSMEESYLPRSRLPVAAAGAGVLVVIVLIVLKVFLRML